MIEIEKQQQINTLSSFHKAKWIGSTIAILFVFGFGIWATYAPISGAVIAQGWITKEGETQVIRHERGGVVASIQVKEGQFVEKGTALVQITDADRVANKKRLETQIAFLTVKEHRLQAEETGQAFPNEQMKAVIDADKSGSNFGQFIDDQSKELTVRRQLHEQQRAILMAQKQSLKYQMEGIEAESASAKTQREILKEQVIARTALFKKGVISKVALQETKKAYAELDGDYRKLKSQIEALPHNLAEIDARLLQIDREIQEGIASELATLRADKIKLKNELEAAKSAVSRITLKAPVSGVVDTLHINTIGSAVAAFEPIVEIVPEREQFVVEVEINPADIEQVSVGQEAKLTLLAFDPANVAPAMATVNFVSPDRRVNKHTQKPYFTARLSFDKNQLQPLPTLVPGMPVEAYLQTKERTFLAIMLEPITKSLNRSFRS